MMNKRRKQDFIKRGEEMTAYVGQWTKNMQHPDTGLTMSYDADGPVATFFVDGRYMVAYTFDPVKP